jgi:FAD/FMN-containing dehydrogenase
VTVEAGVLLSDLIETFLPRGLFPYVVPGTRFVTVGGAIAADVHGKNHHREGGFGEYVENFVLALPTGEAIRGSRHENAELFFATIGGMGLTGTILEATIRLRRVETGWIRQRTILAPDLQAAIAALQENDSSTYSVAWIDCLAKGAALGRSLVFLGEHIEVPELTERAAARRFPIGRPYLSMPVDAPGFVFNSWTIRAFNEMYFRIGARRATVTTQVPAHPYFFPLDAIDSWNRIYGRQGFVQHQSVLPVDKSPAVLSEMLGRIAARGSGSFLAVLKKLGRGSGLISFPIPGFTLALDFPMTDDLLPFLNELDRLVVAGGGRIYLAKDARQSRDTFASGYPELSRFREIRRRVDPNGTIKSRLSERLGI